MIWPGLGGFGPQLLDKDHAKSQARRNGGECTWIVGLEPAWLRTGNNAGSGAVRWPARRPVIRHRPAPGDAVPCGSGRGEDAPLVGAGFRGLPVAAAAACHGTQRAGDAGGHGRASVAAASPGRSSLWPLVGGRGEPGCLTVFHIASAAFCIVGDRYAAVQHGFSQSSLSSRIAKQERQHTDLYRF